MSHELPGPLSDANCGWPSAQFILYKLYKWKMTPVCCLKNCILSVSFAIRSSFCMPWRGLGSQLLQKTAARMLRIRFVGVPDWFRFVFGAWLKDKRNKWRTHCDGGKVVVEQLSKAQSQWTLFWVGFCFRPEKFERQTMANLCFVALYQLV